MVLRRNEGKGCDYVVEGTKQCYSCTIQLACVGCNPTTDQMPMNQTRNRIFHLA